MELRRKICDKLLAWKKRSAGSSALLIEGARRVGKTTIATKFGKENYKSYVLLDFNKVSKKLKDSFFNNLSDLDVLFQDISLESNTILYPRDTLIIFDEIQSFPKAREAIKYLVQDGRYDYIETGSLISIKENVSNITIPSEEEKIRMLPLDLEEFMIARKQEVLLTYIKDCFSKQVKLDRQYHDKAMRLFYEYLLVGGMPQSVVSYIDNQLSFYDADLAKRRILSLYEDDIKKSQKKYSSKVAAIFSHIPSDLSTHEKKVHLNAIHHGALFSDYDESLYWLSDALICNLCYKVNDPNIGFALTANKSEVKCYMADTGLLFSEAFSENEIKDDNLYKCIIDGKLSINKGMLYENAIAQMLVALNKKLYFYSHYNAEKKRNDIEIDFLLSNERKTDFKIIPVEVKSSKNYTATSLGIFKDRFKSRVDFSIIIHPKEFSLDKANRVMKIPPYMVSLLDTENLKYI